jgi:hypothetical protein
METVAVTDRSPALFRDWSEFVKRRGAQLAKTIRKSAKALSINYLAMVAPSLVQRAESPDFLRLIAFFRAFSTEISAVSV